jgi:hypothetical protein
MPFGMLQAGLTSWYLFQTDPGSTIAYATKRSQQEMQVTEEHNDCCN